jgi:cytochrome P450
MQGVILRAPNRQLTFGEGGHYCVGARLRPIS